MQQYSPFYTFLTYLQLGSIMLTFVLLIIGIVVGILAIRALLIYCKNNRTAKEALKELAPASAENEELEGNADAEEVQPMEAEIVEKAEVQETK